MENKIIVNGTQEFMGINIPIIEGGFGENKKVILAKTIAEIHDMELRKVNELINNNIDEFENGVDLLDLKDNKELEVLAKDLGFITSNRQIYCYLLSEQGYMALVQLMRTDKAKAIRKQLRREYFAMREVIKNNDTIKAQLLLDIYHGGQAGVLASAKLTEMETKPLIETIAIQTPKVNYHDKVLNTNNLVTITNIAKDFGISGQRLNNILKELKVQYKQSNVWKPYRDYEYLIPEYCDYFISENNGYSCQTLKWTEKGRQFIYDLLKINQDKIEDIVLA